MISRITTKPAKNGSSRRRKRCLDGGSKDHHPGDPDHQIQSASPLEEDQGGHRNQQDGNRDGSPQPQCPMCRPQDVLVGQLAVPQMGMYRLRRQGRHQRSRHRLLLGRQTRDLSPGGVDSRLRSDVALLGRLALGGQSTRSLMKRPQSAYLLSQP
jgi:hypothetical protein